MIDERLQKILGIAGISSEPAVVRFYRDNDPTLRQSLIVQLEWQGYRIMLRAEGEPDAWTCACFDEDGCLGSVEKFACDDRQLDKIQADLFLDALMKQPYGDMAIERVKL